MEALWASKFLAAVEVERDAVAARQRLYEDACAKEATAQARTNLNKQKQNLKIIKNNKTRKRIKKAKETGRKQMFRLFFVYGLFFFFFRVLLPNAKEAKAQVSCVTAQIEKRKHKVGRRKKPN